MDKNKNHVPVLFTGAKLCFLICIGMGMAVFFADFAGIQSDWTKLLLPIFLSAVICAVLLLLVPSKPACIMIFAALWFLFFWMNKTDIYGGAQTAYTIAENMVSAYFDNVEVQREALSPDSVKQMISFLSSFLSAWQGLTVIVNFRKSRPALTAVTPAIVMILYFAVGQVPYWGSMILFGVGFIGLRALKTGADKNYRAALKSAVVSLVLFAAVTGAVVWRMPSDGYLKEEDKKHIREAVRDGYKDFGEYLNERVFSQSESGLGISEGRLDKAGNLSYTGETVMRVSTNSQVPASIYLKAYAAGNFEANRWEEIDTGSLDALGTMYDADTNEYLKSIWNNSYQAVSDGSDTAMTISPTEAVSGHLYAPYASLLGSEDKMAAEGYMTELSGGQEREIFYAKDFFSLMADADSYIGAGAGGVRVKGYTDYVRENYMSIDGMSEQFKKDYKIADGSSPGTVTDYIKKKFEREDIRYTLEPGSMPQGENIIDYFLYENKKGYCMHFASAAVMIYRLNGIPARYAEGYVIPRGSFRSLSPQGDAEGGEAEFISEIRDYQAHAWPEIYIENFGWVPAEVTPAYTDGGIPEELKGEGDLSASESEESRTEESESEETVPEETKGETQESSGTAEEEQKNTDGNESSVGGKGNSDKNGTSNGSGSSTDKNSGHMRGFKIPAAVLRGILCVLAAIMLCICAVFIVKLRTRRAADLLKPPYDSRMAKVLWHYLMRWLMLYGISSAKGGDSACILKEISEKTKDSHGPEEQALVYVLDKLLKAAYSKQGLDDEEYVRVLHLYRQLAKSIYGQLSPLKKMTAVVLWCLPGKEKDV